MDTSVYIDYALNRLNDINGGNDKFEILCAEIVKGSIGDKNFLPSTGTDAGGDGGIDGWSFGESGCNGKKIKYAFSIQKDWREKIENEVEKTNKERYQEIRFFSNQSIRTRIKESEYGKTFSGVEVTIYDREDIVSFIKEKETLGQFIDLPLVKRGVLINYLREHNQLLKEKKKIENFIPRKIRIDGLEHCDILDYIIEFDKIAILEAPAGYGKTSVLKQFHQNILNSDDKNFLPPAFIELKNYTKGSLLNTVNDAMSCNGDFICVDALLLIDGFDELKDEDKPCFLKELHSFLETNQSYVRKAIISVREKEYAASEFSDKNRFQKIYLEPFSQGDLLKHYSNEKKNLIFDNKIYREYCDNIYYAVNLLAYYDEKNAFAGNIVELLNYLEEKELTSIFRRTINEECAKNMETMALYMVLHQESAVSSEFLSEFGIQCKKDSFSFSHKQILEYMAAKKIALQSLIEIKEMLFSNEFIIPYLKNVFGHTLNLLASTSEKSYSMFCELSKYVLASGRNTDKLLEIENDKIPSKMVSDIFKAAVTELCEEECVTNYPKRLIDFALCKDNVEENLSYLLEKIKEAFEKNTRFHFYTNFLQNIVCQDMSVFSTEIQTNLINALIYFLKNGTEEHRDLINCYFYTICNLPEVKNISKEKSKFVFDKMILYLPDEYQEGLAECLSRFLINSDENFTFEHCLDFYDKVVEKFANITRVDEKGNWKISHIYIFPSFTTLFKKKFDENASLIWKFLKHISKRKHIYLLSSQTSLNTFMNMIYEYIKNNLKHELTEEKKLLLVMLTEYRPDLFNSHILWTQLIEVLSLDDAIDIAKLILKDVETFGNDIGDILRSMSTYFSKEIKVVKDVENLYNGICQMRNQYGSFLFYVIAQSYINNDNVDSDVSKKIFLYVSEEEKKYLLENINRASIAMQNFAEPKKQDFNNLSKKQQAVCIKSIANALEKFEPALPENWNSPNLQNIIYTLQEAKFIKEDKSFIDKYKNKIKWLALYESLEYTISIEGISIAYLEDYIEKEYLLNFLLDNFDKLSLEKNNGKAVITYLSDNYDTLLPFRKDAVKKYLIDYIKNNISNFYDQSVVNAAIKCNVKATDFDKLLIASALILGEVDKNGSNYTRLSCNYACSFIYYRYSERSDEEKNFLQEVVLEAYNSAKELELKKCLAEYYIAHSFCGGCIYKFYVDYICENIEHKVSLSDVEGFCIATKDINCLPHVEKLLNYCLSIEDDNKYFDLKTKIFNMAMKSYELIANSVNEQVELNKVIQSFEKVTKLKGLYKKMSFDWQINFAKRHYIPYDVEKIKTLV